MIQPAKHAKAQVTNYFIRTASRISQGVPFLIALPALAAAPIIGAPEPAKLLKDSPLTVEEQLTTFSVPPGFNIELVAAEPDGGKFVAINFDHAGRMWTMTALEYPLDANEAGAEAKALFARGGRDRVLVFDTPTAPGRQKPRAFADGLVMPLGLLPYQNGAYVQYGGEIRFYRDTDGDGRADKHEAVLTGFGIEDSHLFPHQFTRAPGGWILMAQGAFNYSKVKAGDGSVTDFNKTKLARFTPDGKRFEIIGWGPCNIWGLVIDRLGEIFIQEANDQGWPMMPFLEGASYPLCGDDVPRPYAPPFPKTGEKEMGGTGLSGLAFSEGGDSFPGPWRDVFFIANPITGKIQAIRCHRGADSLGDRQSAVGNYGNGWRLEHLPDFVLCGDPWFRPVAIAFGPDGCLYIVDWYNKIISHNEVPRNHPERDKTRGRIWRVRHESRPPRTTAPDLYKASDQDLLVHLRASNTWEVNAAWQEIVDRRAVSLAPELTRLATDTNVPPDVRLRALWSLEGLGQISENVIFSLQAAPQRSLRREAIHVARVGREHGAMEASGLLDPDRLVRQEAVRFFCDALRRAVANQEEAKSKVAQLLRIWHRAETTKDELPSKWHDYFSAFEAYLVRSALEAAPSAVLAWLDSERATDDTSEDIAHACLALGGTEGARRLAKQIERLKRPLKPDELTLLASGAGESDVQRVLPAILSDPSSQALTLRLLYDNRTRLTDQAALAPLLTDSARSLVTRDPSDANLDLLVRLASGFRLPGLENELVATATGPGVGAERQVAALRALRESGSARVDVFRQFAVSGNDAIKREAVAALAVARSDAAVPVLLEIWPSLTTSLRKTAVDRLASSSASAKQLVTSIEHGVIARDELDGYTLDKLATVLPNDAAVKQLVTELGSTLKPVLRLNGGDGDYIDTDISLRGPFTVESWVKLDPGINNQDSILAGAGGLDANFHDSRFRVWVAGGLHDIVIASKPIAPESWTHVAFTRDAEGRFRLYLNGELDATSAAAERRDFEHLKVGQSNVPGGTAGELAEFRIWAACRTPDEIRATANLALDPVRGLAGRRDKAVDSAPANSPGSFPELSAAARMAALLYHGSGETWGALHGNARIERASDLPPLQTEGEAKTLEAKFARFRALANKPGDLARGQRAFTAVCAVCHTVKGQGGKIGPALDGAGANGIEALLRNVLTPNAAMEAGYRRFRVETKDGEVTDGLLVSQDDQAYVLRQQGSEDLRIPRAEVKRAAFTRLSMMPEGLLEPLPSEQVSDLFAYLKTLK
jgi:putative membrane-bound dehydrogenase-like protein